MDKILLNTHKQSNIILLKIRDYYFNKAKFLNRVMMFANCVPVILAVFSIAFEWGDIVDILIGVLSMIIYVVESWIDGKIEEYVDISNYYRELYDVNVLEIDKNDFYLLDHKIPDENEVVRKVRDYYKYEIWYEEIFSRPRTDRDKEKSQRANVICCQVDNLVYGKHAYSDTAQYYLRWVCVSLLWGILGVVYFAVNKNFIKIFLTITTVYGILTVFYEKRAKAKDAAQKADQLVSYVEKHRDDILKMDKAYERMLQDMIIISRSQNIFVPRKIRSKYLKEENNPFYEELDKIKNLYYEGMKVCKPDCEEEITLLDEADNENGTFKDLHDKLFEMMLDITSVWEEHHINYSLDGGTLLGVIRDNGKFLFWDDDIDLAIPVERIEDAKRVIAEKFGDKYSIQDYSDSYYSPRLADFRIRDNESFITEKDSVLSEKYGCHGIFLDVYCYSPILYNKFWDSLYRRIWIQPIHNRIEKMEFKCYSRGYDRHEEKFFHMKQTYLRRTSWYIKHAHNRAYWCYTPHYLNFISENKVNKVFWCLKKPQPYIKACDLWNEDAQSYSLKKFMNHEVRCPINPERVLQLCYKNYQESPYVHIEDKPIKQEDGSYKFSMSKQVTSLKHVKSVKMSNKV